jgi:ABC-2 type transport system ATP-binding protein
MIRAQDLTKYFGSKRALGPVSFEIADGESVGFLGLNGAGKTTALRIFACDLRPSSGTVRVGDIDAVAHPHEVRKRIGFLPETPPVYTDMHVEDYLTFAGRIRGMSPKEIEKRLPEVFDLTDLREVRSEIVGNLSHGFRQRVGVAQAIVHAPKLLILDEPTRGLDPVQIVEMRSLIQSLKERHTVLISSHILSEIEKTCDRILVLQQGAIIATGGEDELSRQMTAATTLEIIFQKADAREDAIKTDLKAIAGVTDAEVIAGEEDAVTFRVQTISDVRRDICKKMVEKGHPLIGAGRAGGELESIFISLVKGGERARN